MNPSAIKTFINGLDTSMPDEFRSRLDRSVQTLSKQLEQASNNRTSKQVLGNGNSENQKTILSSGRNDTEMFTTISDMINGTQKDFAGFGTMMDNLYSKNKKYFTIIKDYEIMPILIPQVNRVLDFLVDESLSPDVQNEHTFMIKYTGTGDEKGIQKNIDSIQKEMKLDGLLRDVYTNRYKLGREYYMVQDYNKTFDHMLMRLQQKMLNEDTVGMGDIEYLDHVYENLVETVNDAHVSCMTPVIYEPSKKSKPSTIEESAALAENERYIKEGQIDFDLKNLNIVVERSSVVRLIEDAQAEILAESYSRYSSNLLIQDSLNESTVALNEAENVDTSRLEQIVKNLKSKKLRRCTITRFDPAKVFKLKIGGRIIGYLVITDINESNSSNIVNFAQALKDQLLKTRATNIGAATQSAEEAISKELANRIIKAFDPNLGINRIEDIDLMHDFIRNNELYNGNKRVTFYYEDEIFDLSRANDSILTNAVFFTKLYSTLILNNIVTKILRGRGRQIHTVKIGVSPNMKRYIDNAMASLAMPEHNLGTLHGSFEQIMNPFNGASDIVIPTEDDDQYIKTDYIPGQDVDMNEEFLRFLLNSIVTSFGFDSGVIDTTNGNFQFARAISQESLNVAIKIKNEQQDLHPNWEKMCLRILEIMGNDATRDAVNNGQIEVRFFEPKTLIIQAIIDDVNAAKNMAETFADAIPMFNADGMEMHRAEFIYHIVKEKSNYDFTEIEKYLEDLDIDVFGENAKTKLAEIIREMVENIKEEVFGQSKDSDDLTPEEAEYMNMPDENPDEEDL